MKLEINPSKHNLFFKAQDGRFLLLNTLTRARLFVDDELKEVIEQGTIEGVDPQIVNQLLNLGVFTSADELQKFTDLYRRRILTPFEYEFTIIPTLKCNLSCHYCNCTGEPLSHSFLQKFKDFFSSELEKGEFENVAVRIAGGEPLLYPEILFKILEDLSKIAEEHGKKFFSALVTNGTLVGEQLLDSLSLFLNAVQLTFEGSRTHHDSIRYDKEGTFDRVLKSAQMITDADILLNMRVHVSDTNTPGLKELFSILRSSVGIGPQHKTMVSMAPVIKTRICPFHPSRCTETLEAANLLPGAWKAAQESGIPLGGMPSPPYEMLPCPYSTPFSVIVGPSGTFYKCLVAASEKSCPAGSLEKGIISLDPFKDRLWESTCSSCQLLPLCGGGCAWRAYDTDESTGCGGTYDMLFRRVKFYLGNKHLLE